jgi:hypothetical protein
MKKQRAIDPASISYTIAGMEFKAGLRVSTPDGYGVIVGIDPTVDRSIGVRLDGDKDVTWLDWTEVDTTARLRPIK